MTQIVVKSLGTAAIYIAGGISKEFHQRLSGHELHLRLEPGARLRHPTENGRDP